MRSRRPLVTGLAALALALSGDSPQYAEWARQGHARDGLRKIGFR